MQRLLNISLNNFADFINKKDYEIRYFLVFALGFCCCFFPEMSRDLSKGDNPKHSRSGELVHPYGNIPYIESV